MAARMDQVVARIALEKFRFETLEQRFSDSLDFKEVFLPTLKEALEEAYKSGLAAGKEAAP